MVGDKNMTENNLHCPECNHKLTKAGGAWSGRKKVQQHRCQNCGRATIRPLDDKGNRMEAKPYVKEVKP